MKMGALYIVCIFIFSACSQTNLEVKKRSLPEWYGAMSVAAGYQIGYGSGDTLENAKTAARADLAAQSNITVSSRFTLNEISKKESINLNSQSSIYERVKGVELNNVEILKSKLHNNRYFVALQSYFDTKLKWVEQTIKNENFRDVMSENNPLYFTLFSEELQASLGYIPDYRVSINNKRVYLHLADKTIALNDSDVLKLKFEKKSPVIEMHFSVGDTILSGGSYKIDVDIKEQGYFTLLSIDENHIVSVDIANKRVYANNSITYPNDRNLEAEIINYESEVLQQYLALICKKQLNLVGFEKTDMNYEKSSDALYFPSLFYIIEGCEYSSKILRIIEE
ncbi:hypothetical protein GJV85_13365 (plasmid) [Sulfurimonas aquatica]|uniref:Lipoprotein LPP20-like domain-containing protein n=1 Tax=Sulfurimonas aquatica TaxID=2672570 RepID=A0A975B2R5_9BACT|nr:LPP20 family lipoprotein [Sulfurimonas aquatica]QSZ43159.1 hypothetical protein GJV85_13365 [Sulfurimonas aquatica]